ncbi:uncharacterized protein LOC111145494 [Enhydra lutris kenyoni]|uniref:Uncharacterized protein LOC111145494 n=1 Tax=Enhydra lutris kenyoni TaxID=391180 RepID=A0A2Y9JE78_ENHLU|nr:uncharacterized protein LOC111145494 [Enhydra lutris kenyoni]
MGPGGEEGERGGRDSLPLLGDPGGADLLVRITWAGSRGAETGKRCASLRFPGRAVGHSEHGLARQRRGREAWASLALTTPFFLPQWCGRTIRLRFLWSLGLDNRCSACSSTRYLGTHTQSEHGVPRKIKEGASTVLNGEEQLECQQLEGPSSAQRRIRARPMGAPPSCHVQIWSSFKPRPVSCSPSSPVLGQVHLRIFEIKLLVLFNICYILWNKKTEKCLRTSAMVFSLQKYIKIW